MEAVAEAEERWSFNDVDFRVSKINAMLDSNVIRFESLEFFYFVAFTFVFLGCDVTHGKIIASFGME